MTLRWISSNFDMFPIPSRSSHETRKIAKIYSGFNGLSAIIYGVDSLRARLLRRVEALESKITSILSKLLKGTSKRYFKLFFNFYTEVHKVNF
jgi:preprotein translocase subunit SecE